MNIRLIGGNILNYLYNDIIGHIPVHFIRLTFLRLLNKKISASTKILLHTRILNFWQLQTGINVVINQHCLIDCRHYPVIINNNTDIGPYTKIWTLGHDPDSPTHEVKGGPVNIGHHVWIASSVTILPNVTISDGAVIGSASLIHKDVEKLSIMAGNPAKKIKTRNNQLLYELKYNPILE